MVVPTTASFTLSLTDINGLHGSLIKVDDSLPDKTNSLALLPVDADLSKSLSDPYRVEALTPVGASSLYWLI